MKTHNQQYDEARIVRLHEQGLSMATIARRFGLSKSTVRDAIRRHAAKGGAGHDN